MAGCEATIECSSHYGILGGGATGSHIFDMVGIAELVEVALQRIGIRLALIEAIPGRDAVAKTHEPRTVGTEGRNPEKCKEERNEKGAARVH